LNGENIVVTLWVIMHKSGEFITGTVSFYNMKFSIVKANHTSAAFTHALERALQDETFCREFPTSPL